MRPETSWRLKVYGALAFSAAALRADPTAVVDSFYERRVYEQSIQTFQRRAVAVDYDGCRQDAVSCLGKIVFWPVFHAVKGDGRYNGDAGKRVVFANEGQVPVVDNRAPIPVVGMVRAVHPDAVELVFLGSPEAVYGGTTWVKVFGLDRAQEKAL